MKKLLDDCLQELVDKYKLEEKKNTMVVDNYETQTNAARWEGEKIKPTFSIQIGCKCLSSNSMHTDRRRTMP